MKTFLLEIVTPERKVYSKDAEMVIVKGQAGELGILPNHIPLVTPLKIAPVIIKNGADREAIAVHGGFIEVRKDTVSILAEIAESPDDIDIDRAIAAKERAEARLKNGKKDEIDFRRAEIALQRAIARINTVKKNY